MSTARVRTVVIPAAGLGTRFLPLTKTVPKELLPVVDRPLMHYAVLETMAVGIEHVVIVTSPGKRALEEYFTPSPQIEEMLRVKGNEAVADEIHQFAKRLTFSYPIQREQRGLGHAVLCAREAVGNQPFAVLLPDDLLEHEQPALAQMVQAWSSHPGNYLAVEEVPADRISAYGVVDLDPEGHLGERTYRVKGLVEKPPAELAPSNLRIVGRYILMPEVFDALAMTRPGAIGEIQLTDGIALAMEHQPTYAYRCAGTWYDCGAPLGLLHASLQIASRRPDTASQVREWIRGL
jgi:UTP--glucose-1-phosphate uridylyltransferase